MKNKFSTLMQRASEVAASMDKTTFANWEKGLITTKECYDRFLKNNDVKNVPEEANMEEFETFLNGLGYIR